MYDQFKTLEYLHFYGASYGIPKAEREQLIPQLLELVNLSDKKMLTLTRCLGDEAAALLGTLPRS